MASHHHTADVIKFELQLQWEHPVLRGTFHDLPPGPTVRLTGSLAGAVTAPVGAGGRVTLTAPKFKFLARYALEIDFTGYEYLDVDGKSLVAEKARAANDTPASRPFFSSSLSAGWTWSHGASGSRVRRSRTSSMTA